MFNIQGKGSCCAGTWIQSQGFKILSVNKDACASVRNVGKAQPDGQKYSLSACHRGLAGSHRHRCVCACACVYNVGTKKTFKQSRWHYMHSLFVKLGLSQVKIRIMLRLCLCISTNSMRTRLHVWELRHSGRFPKILQGLSFCTRCDMTRCSRKPHANCAQGAIRKAHTVESVLQFFSQTRVNNHFPASLCMNR